MSVQRETENTEPNWARNFNPTVWWVSIAGICAVILFGLIFVPWSYRKMIQQQAENPRPLYIGKLEKDLPAVNRDGSEVSLGQLKDKIYVVGYQYTDCPSGCLGMAGVMKELHEKFGGRADFHLVSISLQPEEDSPEKMDRWVKNHGIDVENWWFLTGDPEQIRKYMNRYFMFFKASENTDPVEIASQGKFTHDQRLALVDGKANVRGYYGVMRTDIGDDEFDRMVRDLEYLFEEKK